MWILRNNWTELNWTGNRWSNYSHYLRLKKIRLVRCQNKFFFSWLFVSIWEHHHYESIFTPEVNARIAYDITEVYLLNFFFTSCSLFATVFGDCSAMYIFCFVRKHNRNGSSLAELLRHPGRPLPPRNMLPPDLIRTRHSSRTTPNTNHTSDTPIRQLSDKLPEAAVDDDDDQTNVNFIITVVGIAAAFVSLVAVVAVLVGRKMCASVSDERVEFARFEDEVRLGEKAMAGNPIYRPATTTYVNPMASSARSGDNEDFLMISV